jgi:hypothetical protein
MVNILNESFCGLPPPSVCVHVDSNGHVYASLPFEQIPDMIQMIQFTIAYVLF